MRVAITGACLLVFLVAAARSSAQDAATFYEDNCAMCHAIGGDAGGFPDLKDITKRRDRQWLIRFIRDPEEAAEHDREAAALVKKFDNAMPPTEGASRELLAAVLDYIDAKSAGTTAAPPPPAPPLQPAVTPADITAGRELFDGRRRTAGGGPGCIGCHRFAGLTVGGGVVGPDLTATYQRLGSRGLELWLANPPTKVMRAIYRPAPLTPEETRVLVAYMAATAGDPAPPPRTAALLAAGGGGLLLVLIAMGVTWSRRFHGVRRAMVAGAPGGHR